jgi:multiple sugar transport system ATP-binding protein
MNFLSGTLIQRSTHTASIRLKTGEEINASVDARSILPGQEVTVGIRPEHSRPSSVGQFVVRTVRYQERLGDATFIYTGEEIGHDSLVVQAPGRTVVKPKQKISVSLPADDLHVFDDQGYAVPRAVVLQDEYLPTEY